MNASIELNEVSKIYEGPAQLLQSLAKAALGIREPSIAKRTSLALRPTTLSFRAGERVGIIGPNGAGKTTLCQVIAGLIPASTGTVKVQGKTTAIFALGLGLREDLTGRENIVCEAKLQGKGEGDIRDIIGETIAFAELEPFIDRPVRTYSSGMKSRLAFATIIHVNPEILIIDEALSAGDYGFGVKAAAKMREICARGKISIIVSHNMGSVLDLCTRCIWLNEGRVVMDGDPTVVTTAYVENEHRRVEPSFSKRFDCVLRTEGLSSNDAISNLEIVPERNSGALSVISAGEGAVFRITLRAGRLSKMLRIRVRIVRHGAWILVDETRELSSIVQTVDSGRDWKLALKMRPVVLAPGSYSATVELLDGDITTAARFEPFKVTAERIPSGGEPLLSCPYDLSVAEVE